MPYIKEDKAKWIKEDYIPDWIDLIKPQPFIPKLIPWINDNELNQWISVEV